ncbi:MAG: putative LPS assembly protein LptD [Balneolales bacterium]
MTKNAVAYKNAPKAAFTGLLLFATGLWNLTAAQVDTTSVEQDGQTIESPPPPGNQQNADSAEDAIDFSASDSLIFSFNPEREARLYGNAEVRHTQGELTAGEVVLNLDQNLMSAHSDEEGDTLAEPVLTQGSDQIRSRRVQYNYVTDKGKFDVARIGIDKGNLIGTEVKRTAPHVIFVEDGIYSTCGLDHPHFYIRAQKMKVVNEDEIFFTNARLFILDIPYPMVFPFGFVPSRLEIARSQSGLLEPSFSYQEQERRGLGIQNIGWFQYFNDYLAGRISFDIFTSGTYYADTRLDYALTDNYTGSVSLGYSKDQGLEPTDPDFTTNIQKSLQLTHNQTISPYARLSANINLRTQDYHRRNSYDIEDRAAVTTSSSASYNYNHPENLYNLSVSARQNRNFQTDVTSLSGPDINFSFRRFTPFQGRSPSADPRWYESFNIQYQSNIRSRFNFSPTNDDVDVSFLDALFDPALHREATGDLRHFDYGLQQDVDAGSSLLSNQYVNFNTSLRYSEYWYPHTIRQEFEPGAPDSLGNATPGNIESRLERGFATARDFSTSASLSTTLYGISNLQIGNLQGFRHTFRPSLSFTYSPDFSDDIWGTYRDVQTNEEGDTRRYPIYEGSLIGGPNAGRQQSLSFSVSNTFEAKQVKRDTTGEVNENVLRIIENMNASVSYNFAADRFKLSDLNMSARTSLVPNVNLNTSAQFSFYDQDNEGRRIDQYIWEDTNRFATLTNFNIQANTNFSGGDGGVRVSPGQGTYYPEHYDPYDQSIFNTIDPRFNEDPITPLTVPWSVDIRFSYRWQRTATNDIQRRAEINANNLRVRVTPEWQLSTSLGYDFIQKELTPARFSITRNLHCWNLSFDWNPFGDFQFYMFRLTVNDSQIRSLFQNLPGLNNLERSSSPINRSGGVGGGLGW